MEEGDFRRIGFSFVSSVEHLLHSQTWLISDRGDRVYIRLLSRILPSLLYYHCLTLAVFTVHAYRASAVLPGPNLLVAPIIFNDCPL